MKAPVQGTKTNDVLIIDDESEVLEVLSECCKEMKIFRNILTAADGMEASKKLRNQNFALIILDIHLPKKTGMDVLFELSKSDLNKISNVILISGDLNRNAVSSAIELGAKNIVVKPLSPDEFIRKVTTVLGKVRPDLCQSMSA